MQTGDRGAGEREPVSEYYQWVVAGKPVAVRLYFDVVDRLLQEVMGGFGLMPRRSVEVGGLLLGAVEENAAAPHQWAVAVTDFEPVPCRHTRGMGWLLSEEERIRFEEALARWHPGEGKPTFAVGFFRSNTREGSGLDTEDLAMYQRYFPDPWAVALLVKPFATGGSVGALFLREGDQVRHEASYQEFPFSRRELGGGPVELGGVPEEEPEERAVGREAGSWSGGLQLSTPASEPTLSDPSPRASQAEGRTAGKRIRGGWKWLSVSLILLVFGMLGGNHIAMNLHFNVISMSRVDPYSIRLSAQRSSGMSVHLIWDRNAPAIQASSRGLLHINDGGLEKAVELDVLQLRNGSVVYRRATDRVKFRLEVFRNDRMSMSESVEYRGE